DPNPSVTNDAPSAGFPVGVTVVTWRATDSAGNSATDTQRVTVTQSQPPPGGEPETDFFGTKAIYPSAPGGQEWHSRWDQNPRTLRNGDIDPYDSRFRMRGSSQTLQIFGDGTAKNSGDQIRMYIGDRTDAQKWQNTEFTMYSMRVSETEAPSHLGFEIQLRTDDGHTSSTNRTNDEGLDLRCDGYAYGYALRWDGRALVEKELKHPSYTNQVTKRNIWDGGTMPRNVWIGMKAIVYNTPAGVKLEIWRDMTDGANGGAWEKIHEYLDAGGWSIDAAAAASCNIPPDQQITWPAPFVIVRNDKISDQRYKKMSIREIVAP
ncbi:MAG: HYR domain-containing protein, partial [Myxococcales bacterium]